MKQTAFFIEKNGEYIPCLKYSVPIFVIRGQRCGTTTIVDDRRKKVNVIKTEKLYSTINLFLHTMIQELKRDAEQLSSSQGKLWVEENGCEVRTLDYMKKRRGSQSHRNKKKIRVNYKASARTCQFQIVMCTENHWTIIALYSLVSEHYTVQCPRVQCTYTNTAIGTERNYSTKIPSL